MLLEAGREIRMSLVFIDIIFLEFAIECALGDVEVGSSLLAVALIVLEGTDDGATLSVLKS